MRIVAFSDIHIDINSKRKDPLFVDKLINHLTYLEGDILVFAGDIAGNTKMVVDFLERTQDLPFEKKLLVPGNHDLWVNQNAINLSHVKYYEILPEIVTSFGWDYLPNNPLLMENTAIVGTIGWYDYSSRNKIWDKEISISDYESKKHPKAKVELMDRYFVKFGKGDREMADQFISDLSKDVNYIERRVPLEELQNLIVLTHMVPFQEFIEYRGLLKYDYFTAYFGNLNMGKTIAKWSELVNVTAIFGQTHIPREKKLSQSLTGHCVPIGYPREYGRHIDLEKLFSNRIKLIEV